MRFLGCQLDDRAIASASTVSRTDRVLAAQLMLAGLAVDSGNPRWSSFVLDRLLEAVTHTKGGEVDDLISALFEVLSDYNGPLTETLKNLIKQLVIKCFTEFRASYEAADFSWMAERVAQDSNSSQAFVALHALPPQLMRPDVAVGIFKQLAYTPSWAEALNALDDDLRNEKARKMLKAWLRDQEAPSDLKDAVRQVIATD